jgi:D-alanyl-lipoteichoic acid acyltransferase DltB (MBOAT superfamily)
MQFNSIEFLLFYLVIVCVYFALPLRFRWPVLLAASYCFYMAWKAKYALLLVASTLVDYFAALAMSRTPEPAARRKYLLMSVVANLSLLFTFKYFNFLNSSVTECLGWLRIPVRPLYLDVLLPVGISFYTFQTMSYAIEVYRGRQKPERNLGRFALYVSFFPQLVAGPIERPQHLLPQLFQKHDFDYDRVRDGLMLMLWGMFKKVVVADRLAVIVDHVYGQPERYPGAILTLGTVFFAFQIYCDFSGYSDIAVGAARVMGVELMRNFNRPYAATSIADFWRRWHISLSTWFRDYVYLPLGGNRVSIPRWFVNLMIVFTVSGLWHGANWTFLIWGALHGSYYVVGWLTRNVRSHTARWARLDRLPPLRHATQVVTTFALVCIGWVFFRAESLAQALYVLKHVPFGWTGFGVYGGFARIIHSMDISEAAFAVSTAAIGIVLFVEYLCKDGTIVDLLAGRPGWLRWSFYAVTGFAVMNLGVAEEIPFVYFQF